MNEQDSNIKLATLVNLFNTGMKELVDDGYLVQLGLVEKDGLKILAARAYDLMDSRGE